MPRAQHWQAGHLPSSRPLKHTPGLQLRGSAPVVKGKLGSWLSAWCVESHPKGRADPKSPYSGLVRGNAIAGVEALMWWAKVGRMIKTWGTHRGVGADQTL